MTTKRALFFALLLLAESRVPSAQSPLVQKVLSVWDGVYTTDQAGRGRKCYEESCAACHGETLGGRTGRALAGPRFFADWGEDDLSSLFNVISTTMPRGEPHSLGDVAYLDIVAYILQRNEYPAGASELTADRVNEVRVLRKEGPGPVPNFALVTVVGCLVEPSENLWVLASGSEPVRTRNPDASNGAERQRSELTPPGPERFELMGVYTSGLSHRGHKMEVKGLLIRGTPNRLNVTAMQMLADRCSP